jgi:hypothetical protein
MPQRRMNQMTKEIFKSLTEQTPAMAERMRGITYEDLSEHEKNAVGLLVYTAAFLYSEGPYSVEDQKQVMIEDAERKGKSGEQLLKSNLRVADVLEQLRGQGHVGKWFYVEQASSDSIQNGLDAQGADWIVEDLKGDRKGFKILQGGTTFQNVALKMQDLESFYGEHMTEGSQIVGLFPTLNRHSDLLEGDDMSEFILNALSNTAPVAPSVSG